MLILNDLHFGVKRMSGTTLESQSALKDYLYKSFEDFLQNTEELQDHHLVINGDLFDSFTVDPQDVLRTYSILHNWMTEGNLLTLISGNHDANRRGDKLSSFHLLANLLQHNFSDALVIVDDTCGLTLVGEGVWAIPHMPNQDLFDLEIEKARQSCREDEWLLLHCNVASTFCEHSDHSLNLSWDQMQALPCRAIFAHEHQGRNVGRHVVLGNQWPSSISDCLAHGSAQADGLKWAGHLTPVGLQKVNTWDALGSYIEVDWRQLDTCPDVDFIRVVGSATAEESGEVVSAVANFRSTSKAFVVGNAVAIEGLEGMEELAEANFEEIRSFDVLNALLEMLDPREQEIVKGLANVETD